MLWLALVCFLLVQQNPLLKVSLIFSNGRICAFGPDGVKISSQVAFAFISWIPPHDEHDSWENQRINATRFW